MTLYLYRKWRRPVTQMSPPAGSRRLATVLALAIALLLPVAAQWRAPRPERATARAIGVLEVFPSGARRLIPVALYYERRYYDAGLYRASPVPFTLSTQTVYEVQRFGKPIGTFTVWKASTAAEGFWVGSGVFRTTPNTETLAKAKKPAAPVALEDPTRPVLHRREGSEGDRPVARKSTTPAEVNDPERPKLHRKDDAADSSSEKTETRSASNAAPATTDAAQDSGADHPILRRGKPGQEQSGGDLPSQSGVAAGRTPETAQRQVAVSDAGSSQAHDLLFALAEPQRSKLESAARELARSELARLAPMRGLSLPGAPAKTAASPQLSQLNLEDEQFVPYDLDYKDYATVVFSGRYRPSASGASPAAGPAKERSWVVTVIARQDGDKLTNLYSSVSDPRELDLYPELRLVDAVDPEGNGRFALLFREQKRDGVSWLVGRVAGYELQTIFETAAR